MLPPIRKCPRCEGKIEDGESTDRVEAEVTFPDGDEALLIAEFHSVCLLGTPPDAIILLMYKAATDSKAVRDLINNHPDRVARRANFMLN